MRKTLLLLILLLGIVSVSAHKVELVEHTGECLIDCHSVYKITAEDVDIILDDYAYWFEFRDLWNQTLRHANKVDNMKDFDVQLLQKSTKDVLVEKYDVVCSPDENSTTICHNEPYNVYEPQTVNEWVDAYEQKIPVGESRYLKVLAKKKWNEQIDNVLVLKDDENPRADYGGYVKYTEFAWWNSSWNRCMQFDISNSLAETFTNYPALLTYNASNTTSESQQFGQDLRIVRGTSCADGGNQTALEIEYYNNTDTTRNATIWFAANLTASTNTSFLLYFNNSAATLAAPNSTYGAFSVWDSNFKGVYHWINNTLVDATGNFNGTTGGTVSNVSGRVSLARTWDSNDTVDTGTTLGNGGANNVTIESFVRHNACGGSGDTVFNKFAAGGARTIYLQTSNSAGTDCDFVSAAVSTDCTSSTSLEKDNVLTSTSIWYYVSMKYINGVNVTLYAANNTVFYPAINTIATGVSTLCASGAKARIGYGDNGPVVMNGELDETRISYTARSDNWMRLTNLLINNPSTFQNLGAEVELSPITAGNETWVSPIFEQALSNHTISVSWDGAIINYVLANFTWNGTIYQNHTNTTISNSTNFTMNLRLPVVSLNDTNVTFQWTFIGVGNGTNYSTSSITRGQELLWAYYVQNITYVNPVVSNTSNTFRINMSKRIYDAPIFLHNLTIEYDGTNRTQAILDLNTTTSETWNVTFNSPSVFTDTTFNFRSWINVSDGGNFTRRFSSNLTQLVTSDGVLLNESWNSPVFETVLANFSINITTSGLNVTVVNFTHNNTFYNSSQITNVTGSTTRFNISLRVPLVAINQTNLSFQWNWTLSNGSTNVTALKNQTVLFAYNPSEFNWSANITETTTGDYQFNISNYGGQLDGVSFLAILQWNATNYTTTTNTSQTATRIRYDINVTPGLLGNGQSLTNVSINVTPYFNISFNGTTLTRNTGPATQRIWRMILTSCLAGTESQQLGIQYSIRDADTLALLPTADITLGSYYVYTNITGRPYTITSTNNETPQICVFPQYEPNFRTDRNLTVGATGYTTSSQVITNFSTPNTQTNVTILLQNSTGGTNIIFELLDENDDPVINYTFSVELYNGTSFNFLTSGMSDFQGQRQFTLDTTDEYRVNITNQTGGLQTLVNGDLASVGPFQILATTLTFRILLGEVVGIEGLASTQLFFYNLTYGSPLNFTWNDVNNVSSSVLFTIDFVNGTNVTQVYTNTSTADSGTMLFELSTQPIGLYVGKAYMVSNVDGNTYLLQVIEADTRPVSPFGTDGLFFVMISYLTLGLLASWNPTVSFMMGFALMTVMYWMDMWIISLSILGGLIVVGAIAIIRFAKE